jgi:uncharacterized protein
MIELREKVAHLARPESYPGPPAAVEVVQTHMSCVFLTDRHAWKLKKPVRHEFLDFSTLEARRIDCEEEVRLNRRLAHDVYLGVVPLNRAPDGRLALGGAGDPVDWLVKMRRLPRHLMLDQALRENRVRREDVRSFTARLCDFYRRTESVAVAADEYRARFRDGICSARDELADARYGLPRALVVSTAAGLLDTLDARRELFDERVSARRIVEGHGDLRPEHVFLGPDPQFIDCLEFKREWRILDPADELSYLAMECEWAGAPWIGDTVLATYRECSGDAPPALLTRFYKSYRALVRAKLCAWHLADHPDPADQGKWSARAERYLELTGRYAATPPVQ